MNRIKLNRIIWNHIRITDTVLDIGCGLEPQRFFIAKNNILCEPNPSYVRELQRRFSVTENYSIRGMTAQHVSILYPDKCVDSIFLLDVLEHIPKEEGLRVIKGIQRIARKQIVVFTPLGYVSQEYRDGNDPWGLEGGEWQKHRSGWVPEDFDASWQILACRHYQYIDGEGNVLKSPEGAFWAIKNLTDGGETVKLDFWHLNAVTLYDCGIILVAHILRLFPAWLSKRIVLFAIRTFWWRFGV